MGSVKSCLLQQFEISWQLLSYHLTDLGTEECLWRPNARGLHVYQNTQGRWIADWPEQEGYSLGPSSIAWTSWHILFWWSMTLNHSFSDGQLSKEAIFWPGSGKATCEEIHRLRQEWIQLIEGLSDADLESPTHTRWPFQDRPFADVVAWLNIELAKNAAEIGYARFLYACRG